MRSSEKIAGLSSKAARIYLFGVDTGVGKTLAAALLLWELRRRGERAAAVKPFAAGAHRDARIFHRIQGGVLPWELVEPFYFKLPLTPMIAAELEGKQPAFKEVCARLEEAGRGLSWLIVEGCGGLLSPVAPDYDWLDIMRSAPGFPVLVARDALGVLHQTLCAARALQSGAGAKAGMAVLSARKRQDLSAKWNAAALKRLLPAWSFWRMPWLGKAPERALLSGNEEVAIHSGAMNAVEELRARLLEGSKKKRIFLKKTY